MLTYPADENKKWSGKLDFTQTAYAARIAGRVMGTQSAMKVERLLRNDDATTILYDNAASDEIYTMLSEIVPLEVTHKSFFGYLSDSKRVASPERIRHSGIEMSINRENNMAKFSICAEPQWYGHNANMVLMKLHNVRAESPYLLDRG